MPAYDSRHFDPPAPLARVILRGLDGRQTVSNIPMLIDSGADVTLIPRKTTVALNLNLDPKKRYELQAFDGSSSVADVVEIDLLFLGKTVRGLYLVLDSEIGILGRDVLNHVIIMLDGPELRWQQQK
jgi:hypothetical protein